MSLHKDLTGTDLHEPKGVAAAAAGTVYTANGSGSGTWTAPKTSYIVLQGVFTDISTAQSIYLPVPVAGTIKKIYVTLDGAITTADSALTFAINGTSIDSSGITAAQSGSGAGTTFSSTPSGHNTPTAGQYVQCATDGASSGVAIAHVAILIQVS